MISMHTLQNLFIDAVFHESGSMHASNQINDFISQNKKLNSIKQIEIYRNSIFGGLTAALKEIYPVCCKLVGDDFFDFMSTQYICQNKSISPDLSNYGESLSDFIFSFKAADSLPYLSDITKLEWAWHRAFYSADHNGLNLSKLNELTKAQQLDLVFHTPPDSTLISSSYPIHKIWNTNQQTDNSNEIINLDDGPVKLIIWRRNYDMHIDPLHDDEWTLLSEINKNILFNDICENNLHLKIDTLLQQCVKNEWISDFSIL